MSEFLHMGGYAFFVWTSYGLAFVVLLGNVVIPIWRRRQFLREIRRKVKRSSRARDKGQKSLI